MAVRLSEIVVDAADPERLARFWSTVLGWTPTGRYDGPVEIADPAAAGPSLVFVWAAEPKREKNRIHLDLEPVDGTQAEEVDRLVALGARPTDVGQGDDVDWVVLADPEGNEFCVLR